MGCHAFDEQDRAGLVIRQGVTRYAECVVAHESAGERKYVRTATAGVLVMPAPRVVDPPTLADCIREVNREYQIDKRPELPAKERKGTTITADGVRPFPRGHMSMVAGGQAAAERLAALNPTRTGRTDLPMRDPSKRPVCGPPQAFATHEEMRLARTPEGMRTMRRIAGRDRHAEHGPCCEAHKPCAACRDEAVRNAAYQPDAPGSRSLLRMACRAMGREPTEWRALASEWRKAKATGR